MENIKKIEKLLEKQEFVERIAMLSLVLMMIFGLIGLTAMFTLPVEEASYVEKYVLGIHFSFLGGFIVCVLISHYIQKLTIKKLKS